MEFQQEVANHNNPAESSTKNLVDTDPNRAVQEPPKDGTRPAPAERMPGYNERLPGKSA